MHTAIENMNPKSVGGLCGVGRDCATFDWRPWLPGIATNMAARGHVIYSWRQQTIQGIGVTQKVGGLGGGGGAFDVDIPS